MGTIVTGGYLATQYTQALEREQVAIVAPKLIGDN